MIPLFKSTHSVGKSILNIQKRKEPDQERADSIQEICEENNIEFPYLIDDAPSGFLEAYTYLENVRIGLRINIASDTNQKNKEALDDDWKGVILAKNYRGYQKLLKIYTKSSLEFSINRVNRISIKELKHFWNKDDLLFCVPFYDSFLFKNNFTIGSGIFPDLSLEPIFFVENNETFYDDILGEKVIDFCSKYGYDYLKTKTIYYKNRKDFNAFMTFKCIHNHSTMEKPRLDHMSSPEFCFESWKDNL